MVFSLLGERLQSVERMRLLTNCVIFTNIRIVLALQYCMLRDYDLFNQLINSIQRQIRLLGKDACEHVVIFTKMLKISISDSKKNKKAKIETLAEKIQHINLEYFTPTLLVKIDEDFIDSLIEGIKSAPGPHTQIGVEYAGGVISKVAPDTTAYYWRDIAARWEIKATWEDRTQDSENIDWALALGKDFHSETYGADVNQQDPYLNDWKPAYYAGNLERLLRIKQEWDPENYFHFPQGISSKT